MQCGRGTGGACGRIVPSLEVDVVYSPIARGARQEVELPRRSVNDRVSLEGPGRCRRNRVKSERFVRGRRAAVQVQEELAPVCVVQRDRAPDREVS